MGVLVNGVWHPVDPPNFKLDPSKQAGTFLTPHEQIEVQGDGRYILYVCAGCPFAARPWLVACATGMDVNTIRIVRVFPANQEDGWFFKAVSDQEKKAVEEHRDTVEWEEEEPYSKGQFSHLHQVYTSGDSQITGRVTVPLLFDSQTNTCISSESADCVKILLERFSSLHYQEPSAAGNMHHIDNENGGERINFYPNAKKDQIDQEMMYMSQNITSIVYGIHFAKTQQLFDAKCHQFFETLFKYEKILTNRDWILQDESTPSILDFILFATVIRFDVAYGPRFRMTKYTIRDDFPSLWSHCCRVYHVNGVKRSVHFNGILAMYYKSLPLCKKAGLTVGRLNVNYEKHLETDLVAVDGGGSGGDSGFGGGDLNRFSGHRVISMVGAAFLGGAILGVALTRRK